MDRCTLSTTKPLVSDKVAKVLTTKNALYEKELSYVCKKLDKEKNYCTTAIENAKRKLIKTLSANDALPTVKKKPNIDIIDYPVDIHERSNSLPTTPQLKRVRTCQRTRSTDGYSVKEKGNALSSVIAIPGTHRRYYTTSNDDPSLSPKSLSSTDTDDDIFGSFVSSSMQDLTGSSLPNFHASEVEIPDILVTDLDNEECDVDTIEKPLGKMSLMRSYSTGDIENASETVNEDYGNTCSSPVQIRRAHVIPENVHGIDCRQIWKEDRIANASEHQLRYGSLDDLAFQSFRNMLSENSVPLRPKPRCKPYSEEPFYLRKKCLLRKCLDKKDIHKSAPEGLADSSGESEESLERPLASILPPIVLPSIYTTRKLLQKYHG